MIRAPILPARIKALEDLRFPLVGTAKIDGMRCLKVNDRILTRSFKKLPNDHIRGILEQLLPNGADGELLTEHQNNAMVKDEVIDFRYFIFDLVDDPNEPYLERQKKLIRWYSEQPSKVKQYIKLIQPVIIDDMYALSEFYRWTIKQDLEGVVLRDPHGPYKQGRSTPKEQYFLKLKPFYGLMEKIETDE